VLLPQLFFSSITKLAHYFQSIALDIKVMVESYQGTHSSQIVEAKAALSVNGIPEITEAVSASIPPFRPFQTVALLTFSSQFILDLCYTI
jgi:hypothetical protein